ncbi:MTH1187 family thiamine-binding protein [Terrabacter terrae]|uniref:MTH1187 family thiamine-binding protein n=2 Tax=Terrabacter terrae TaxID=318434 RepID=A0ABN2UFY0_9MICO
MHEKGGQAAGFTAAYGVGMLIAFSVAPTVAADDTGSVSDAVARAIRVVRDSGLPHRTDAMFTTIEGEWDECMAVVKQCCDVLAQSSPRVGLVLKADIRPGFTGELDGKLERLEHALDRQGGTDGESGG